MQRDECTVEAQLKKLDRKERAPHFICKTLRISISLLSLLCVTGRKLKGDIWKLLLSFFIPSAGCIDLFRKWNFANIKNNA